MPQMGSFALGHNNKTIGVGRVHKYKPADRDLIDSAYLNVDE